MKSRSANRVAAMVVGMGGALAFAQPRAVVQQPEEALAQVGVAIDGATLPPLRGVRTAGARIAPDVPADGYDLPAAMPAASDQQLPNLDVAGYVEPLPRGNVTPNWTGTADGGKVWAVELTSRGATALRVRMAGRFGRDGLALRVYDPVGGWAFGPYRVLNVDEAGHWWTTIIFGESIGLEFHAPAGLTPQMPEIDAIGYFNLPPPGVPGPRGCTQRDVACEPSWADSTAQAVCMLATVSGGGVNGFCTGALLNRNPADGSPLIMTANHCIGTQSAADSAAFVWNFQNSTCNGTPPNPNSLPRSNGSLLLRAYPDSDWNLLGSYEPPASRTFLGWDSGFWVSFADATGIHHPGGTFKKISFGENVGALYGYYCDQNGQNCFWAHVWNVPWDIGATAPGSSGSPVMDTSHRVRGTLTGGPDNCTGQYGRFATAYDDLEPFLNDIADPVYVQASYSGFERGTSDEPFNRVYEASFCVQAGHTLQIRPGNYPDRCTIWRPMTLSRAGVAGLVRIGD